MANHPSQPPTTIVLAGSTGSLGLLIAYHLRQRGATVRALVRPESSLSAEAESLRLQGAEVVEVDYNHVADLRKACAGADCVVSALSGLRPVIVEAQTRLLEAAVAAGVPRFIPSDYSADFTRLPAGSNRNFDLRREFQQRLDKAPIQATSIFNGMFMDLFTGQVPFIQSSIHRIVYWGDANQPMESTTMVDTANFTAAAALDPTTPRYLCIAGDVTTVRDLRAIASEVTDQPFKLLRVGGLGVLKTMMKATKMLMPAENEVFPPWQGMQYMHNMLSGQVELGTLDNDRYPDIRWTKVRDVLKKG